MPIMSNVFKYEKTKSANVAKVKKRTFAKTGIKNLTRRPLRQLAQIHFFTLQQVRCWQVWSWSIVPTATGSMLARPRPAFRWIGASVLNCFFYFSWYGSIKPKGTSKELLARRVRKPRFFGLGIIKNSLKTLFECKFKMKQNSNELAACNSDSRIITATYCHTHSRDAHIYAHTRAGLAVIHS